jgi:cyclophilin family peptidyl-prolyl cis-trans isomerase
MKRMIASLALLAASSLASPAMADNPTVELKTSKGVIVVELLADKAPKSVANFIQYARDGHYNGTIFHRVIPGFVVQGGGFDAKMVQKPTRAPIVNEAGNGVANTRGTLAMARTMDPDSATAQFYINLADNSPSLNRAGPQRPGYAVFGRVVKGMEVVDAIAAVRTGQLGPHGDVPLTPIVLQTATVSGEAH